VIEGYNARIFVERGHLVTRDGFPNEGEIREIRFPRGRSRVERIVVRAPGGTISMEAIQLVFAHGDRDLVRGLRQLSPELPCFRMRRTMDR
jgi:hypothetical protein